MRFWIALGAACAAPFAFLALPEGLADVLNGTLALVAWIVAVVVTTLTGVLGLVRWLGRSERRLEHAEATLDAMGYANTRNARQQRGGRHGRT